MAESAEKSATMEPEEVKVEAVEEADSVVEAPTVQDNGEHSLVNDWTLYVDQKKSTKPTSYKTYQNNLLKLGNFNTLEGFWRYYSHLSTPDNIPVGQNIFMFKNDYVPAWETFPRGGTWIVKVRKRNGVIGRLWEELLFACVGELFEEPDIAGVMLSSRGREDLLAIWNMDNTANPEARFNVGERLREILNLDESTQVEYKDFKASIKDGSTYRNAKAYVYAAQTSYPSGQSPSHSPAKA